MSLIAMACYDTEANGRLQFTKETLASLKATVNFRKHRLIVVDNGCDGRPTFEIERFVRILFKEHFNNSVRIIKLHENIGTARAINKVWAFRKSNEHAIKMDNDICIDRIGWVEELEEAIERDAEIGQVGLKRKDCWEHPDNPQADWRSELKLLNHIAGEPWIVVEKVKHVIGSCVMHSSKLLDKVGYLYQPSLYGYDDVIMSHRTHLAGMYSCFLPHIRIDHIDNGGTEYQSWKERHSGEQTQNVIRIVNEMYAGIFPIKINHEGEPDWATVAGAYRPF
jgi:GT2 family glycosyltransferase